MAEKITMWEASDGSTFNSEELANHHDERIALSEYIDENPIYGLAVEARIDGSEFLRWADEQKRIVIMLLPEEGKNGN